MASNFKLTAHSGTNEASARQPAEFQVSVAICLPVCLFVLTVLKADGASLGSVPSGGVGGVGG